ncbi:hypothetical protein sscle_03g028580 [Sclerotinia sclerotiorum 1980 UF-70]|nr:hypothetical protein sscle_03g028580 [Sclerotinia sclerotiorum 1980 UF-70]
MGSDDAEFMGTASDGVGLSDELSEIEDDVASDFHHESDSEESEEHDDEIEGYTEDQTRNDPMQAKLDAGLLKGIELEDFVSEQQPDALAQQSRAAKERGVVRNKFFMCGGVAGIKMGGSFECSNCPKISNCAKLARKLSEVDHHIWSFNQQNFLSLLTTPTPYQLTVNMRAKWRKKRTRRLKRKRRKTRARSK